MLPAENNQTGQAARYLLGALGGPNFGDEAILKIWTSYYCEQFQDHLVCDGFSHPAVLFPLSERVSSASTEGSLWGALRQLESIFEQKGIVTLEDIDLVLESFCQQSLKSIHFIGGGYINSLWPHNYALLGLARFAGWRLGIPVIATGQGLFPPLKGQEEAIHMLFSTLEGVDTRDSISQTIAKAEFCTGDDAFLYFSEPSSFYCQDVKRPFFGLSLQKHLFDGKNVLNTFFSDKMLTQIRDAGFEDIFLLEAAPEDIHVLDRDIFNRVNRYAMHVRFISTRSLIENGLPYHPESLVLTSRYHIHFFYSMMNVKGVALYENDYYRNKHFSVRDMGSLWPVMKADDTRLYGDIGKLFPGMDAVDSEIKIDFLNKKTKMRTNMENIRTTPPQNKDRILALISHALTL